MLSLREVVSADLENLEKGYKGLLEQREQIDRAIEQQSGGIQYARMLIGKIDEREQADAAEAAIESTP